uniref:Sugar phosphate transporter domain-containing protein n=1 Tax=Aegilops tauschii TaxID=37682 RepID=M8BS84_AEGTA
MASRNPPLVTHVDPDAPPGRKAPDIGNRHNQSLLSGFAYCIASCSMILVNKFVLSGYGFNAGIFLMIYQNIVSVTIVSALSLSGVIPTEPLTWKLIKVWLPVNIIFVGMLITSMFSLKYINVAMLTILKNVANVLTASGETYFFKKQHDRQVWISLMLMLTLRHVMDSAKQATKSGNLNELSMVLLNNVLSLPLGIILVLGFNEVEYLLETLVGSLNKIPLSIAGILLFKVRTSMENSISILLEKGKVQGPILDSGSGDDDNRRGGGSNNYLGGFFLFIVVLLLDYLKEFEKYLLA